MREIKFRCFEKEKGMWGMDSNSAMNPAMFWGIVANIKGEPNIMQFTGLKDKNGKEIYESDIVRCYDTSGEKVYDREVEFFKFRKEIWSEEFEGKTKVEIVGNIYENPELLVVD